MSPFSLFLLHVCLCRHLERCGASSFSTFFFFFPPFRFCQQRRTLSPHHTLTIISLSPHLCLILFFFQTKFARTGPPEEMGQQYDANELHESEIKTETIQVMRRHSELSQLVKYLKQNLKKHDVVDGKDALDAPVPAAPRKDLFKLKTGLIKSPTEWPGVLSKSTHGHAGTENSKYAAYTVNSPTEHQLRLWFVSLCQVSGAQDTEGFQHFLKSEEHRIAEFSTGGGCKCVLL